MSFKKIAEGRGARSGYSISHVLYDWLHEKRLMTQVARRMGKNDSTLSAELRPSNNQAKLGADELIPLFEAIRASGYGDELKGVLYRFISEIKGSDLKDVSDRDLISHMLELHCSLGILSGCAARIPQMTDIAELSKLNTMLRTEVMSVILKMESVIEARIRELSGDSAAVTTAEWAPAGATAK